MSKRDYYEVLGVAKNAGDDEIKRPTARQPSSTIPIKIRAMRKPKNPLKRLQKPMKCSATPISALVMTDLVTKG